MEIIVMSVGANTEVRQLLAICGHEDSLGYFANTVCGKCARANHEKALGK